MSTITNLTHQSCTTQSQGGQTIFGWWFHILFSGTRWKRQVLEVWCLGEIYRIWVKEGQKLEKMTNHMGQMLIQDFFCKAGFSRLVAPNEIMPNMLRNDESRATIDGNHVLV
jgi:hypothetical protein